MWAWPVTWGLVWGWVGRGEGQQEALIWKGPPMPASQEDFVLVDTERILTTAMQIID